MPGLTRLEIQGDEQVRQALQRLGVQVLPLTRREMYNQLLALRNRVARVGPRPSYPINWDSEKQRRAYFATKGFGHGIPYRRGASGQRVHNAWRVVRSGSGYALENPLEKALYVYGDENMQGQSRIHQGRWPLWARLIDEYIDKVPAEAEREIESYARKLGL